MPSVRIPKDAAFWALVELARSDWEGFERALGELPTDDVAGFAHYFYGLEISLVERALELIPSEDGADEFCAWVVGRGKQMFVRALADPGTLDASTVKQYDTADPRGLGSAVRYAAERIYSERTGEELNVFVEPLFEVEDSAEYEPLVRARQART